MKRIVMFLCLIVFGVSGVLAGTAKVPPLTQLFLSGKISDMDSQSPLEASIVVKQGAKRVLLGTSAPNGTFKVSFPINATAIVIEAKNYQPLTLPVSVDRRLQTKTDAVEFIVPFKLRTIERQVSDRPYSQTEQKEFELKNTEAGRSATGMRVIRLVDEDTRTPVEGEVCLFFTNSQSRKCFNITKDTPEWEAEITEKDIIAIEVRSGGYHPFNGNLIIDKMDGLKRSYEIKMRPQRTVLSLHLTNASAVSQCRVYDVLENGTLLTQFSPNQYFGSLKAAGRFRVELYDQAKQLVFDEYLIDLDPGLNFRVAEVLPKKSVAVKANLPTNALKGPKGLHTGPDTVQFAQSDYKLTEEGKKILDRIAFSYKTQPEAMVRIVGHTDNVGSSRLNQTLSEFRAKVTANYLYNMGVPSEKLFWSGVGSRYPVASNGNELTRKLNRRVEVQLIKMN